MNPHRFGKHGTTGGIATKIRSEAQPILDRHGACIVDDVEPGCYWLECADAETAEAVTQELKKAALWPLHKPTTAGTEPWRRM